jgi:hypothetical protein
MSKRGGRSNRCAEFATQQTNTMESHSISRRHPQQIASECSRTAKPIESRAAPFVEYRLGRE